MKIDNLFNEHKKGVKAIKYAKKPVPVVGPEALKKKAKAKTAPPKTELEKHSKLATKLEGVAEGSAQEKLHKRHQELRKKSNLPDPDYYKELKATYDLPDEERYKKAAELKKKYSVKEAKRPDRPPPKTDLKVGDDVIADTSKEDYPGGHKERRGKVTRVGQQGVHIKPDDSDEPEWHPYKIVKKSEKSMKEAKQAEFPKPRNFVAKNMKTAGAGKHKDAKKAMKDVRGQKHKNKEMAETYDQVRAIRIRYALMLREGDWDIQSDEMIPPEYEMSADELKAIRNAEFSDEDKIQAMVKLAAGGTSDEEIAKMFDMDQETVAGILDDYVEDIEAETDQDADVKEAEMGKVIDYKPGQTATINTGPGMTTILDLKKNPTSLSKDPATGKLKLSSAAQNQTQPTATAQSTVKAGDAVEIDKTTEDLLRLAGIR